jgi:hypothetical protein
MDNQINKIGHPIDTNEANYIDLQDQRREQSLLYRVSLVNVTNLKKSSERILQAFKIFTLSEETWNSECDIQGQIFTPTELQSLLNNELI